MGASVIEVRHIPLEHAEELLFMQNQQMIETFPAYASQETFAARIGLWSIIRCPQELDSCPAHHAGKERTERAAVVTDQEPGRLPQGCCFSALLGDPGIGGMASHSNMQDFSALEFDDKEGNERTEEEVRHRKEVAGPDLMYMVGCARRSTTSGRKGVHVPGVDTFGWCVEKPGCPA
jgi:hypothetical protein